MPLFANIYLIGLAIIWICVTLLWLFSLRLKDSSIVDIFWGTGFVIVGWIYFALTEGYLPRKLLITILVTVWGLRLSLYIGYRNIGKGEDFRYQKWRAEAGSAWWWRSYFKVFFMQGIIMWLVSVPILGAQVAPGPAPLTLLDYAAIPVWLIGFAFEAGGDWQLMRFKANPANKGEVLDSGLWRYTRHPNYFGDAVQWWSFYMLAAASGAWWTVFSPVAMTYLLMRISGVRLLESTLKESRPAYHDYIRRTSAFFPRPPRP